MKFWISVLFFAVVFSLPGPGEEGNRQKAARASGIVLINQSRHLEANPIPNVNQSKSLEISDLQDSKILQGVEALLDKNGPTTYVYSQDYSKFLGEAIGYGIRVKLQYYSPDKAMVLPHQEPEGRWILMKDPEGKQPAKPACLCNINVLPFKLKGN